jgi:hypothetical protein
VTEQLPLDFNSFLLSFFSLLLTGDTTGGRQFLLFRWYLLLTGDITGRRPASLLFIFTATFHAGDQCAAILIFSQWAFTNADVDASVLASTLFSGPTPDEYVNVSRILLQMEVRPATGYYCELGR